MKFGTALASILAASFLVPKMDIARGPLDPLAIQASNAGPCAVIFTSTDGTNWQCSYTINRCDGSTNPWQSISWTTLNTNNQQFWVIKNCEGPAP